MWQFIRPDVCIPPCHDETHHALTLKFSLNWDQNAAKTTADYPYESLFDMFPHNAGATDEQNYEFQNAMFTFVFPSMLPPSAGASASVETESCDAARAREDSGRKRGLPPCRWMLQQLVRTGWVWQKIARNLSSAKWRNMWVEQICLNMCILLTQTDKCTYEKT